MSRLFLLRFSATLLFVHKLRLRFERLLCWLQNREEKLAICIFAQGNNLNNVSFPQTLVASLAHLDLFDT